MYKFTAPYTAAIIPNIIAIAAFLTQVNNLPKAIKLNVTTELEIGLPFLLHLK